MELTLINLAKHFTDEAAAWELVEAVRWDGQPVCPHCGSMDRPYFINPTKPRTSRTGTVSYRRLWKCGDCGKQFSVLVGTILEDSRIPLSKWLLAIHLMCAGKNGTSANELKRTLSISYKSAWFMCHRIREAMKSGPLADMLSGTVEADETYIGGKRKGTPKGRPGPDSHKSPVVTLVERNGEARSRALESVTGKNVREMLHTHVQESATIMTDEFPLYHKATAGFAGHGVVTHKEGEYVRGVVHTNTAEGYFSQLKRSLDGTYHHVSAQHLHRYLCEFDYRYNTRKMNDSQRTALAIKKVAGKRLMYRETSKDTQT